MKILVPVKRVIDHNVKIRIKADGSAIETDNVKMSMNPFDEIAIEEAVRLLESGVASEVIALSIGNTEETLRAALAMGASRAILINKDVEIQPLIAAKLIAKIVNKIVPDMVILGKQAIDDDANQTGQILAGLLGWGQGTFASKLEIENNQVTVSREIDDGEMQVKLTLPCVITTDLRLNEPRYATLPNIMKARSKPLENISDFSMDISPRLEILEITEPMKRIGGVKIENIDELISILRNRGVI